MAMSTDPIAVRMPDGREATFEEMQAYGKALQAFVCEQEARLPEVTEARRHNEIVDFLHELAEGYNTQLRLFKEAEARRQQALLANMVRLVGG